MTYLQNIVSFPICSILVTNTNHVKTQNISVIKELKQNFKRNWMTLRQEVFDEIIEDEKNIRFKAGIHESMQMIKVLTRMLNKITKEIYPLYARKVLVKFLKMKIIV